MTKYLGRVIAALGLIVALALVWREEPRSVFALLRTAGPGLVLAAVAHVLPMLANARDWQTLIAGTGRPGLLSMLRLVWIRAPVNSLLPVARIGGEIVSFRLLTRAGLRASTAAASLVVDMQLTLISQLVFTLIGIVFLILNTFSRQARFIPGCTDVLPPCRLCLQVISTSCPFVR